jgi:microbial collagenase
VTDINPPTVSAPTVTPSTPLADQPAVFNTTATADGDGHRIVRYDWAFGDGTEATTTAPQVVKVYSAVGTFIVRVTVTDDVGRTASAVASVSVAAGTTNAPIARFTVSPEVPVAGQSATFDGSSSSAGTRAVTVSYTWNFGDGSAATTSTQPAISKTFAAAGTYAVRLTVTDNNGQANTVGVQVVVTAP